MVSQLSTSATREEPQLICLCLQVGQVVEGRVLSVSPGAQRLTLTLKPALLGSKLPLLVSPAAAVVGAKAHGVVTGIKVGECVRVA